MVLYREGAMQIPALSATITANLALALGGALVAWLLMEAADMPETLPIAMAGTLGIIGVVGLVFIFAHPIVILAGPNVVALIVAAMYVYAAGFLATTVAIVYTAWLEFEDLFEGGDALSGTQAMLLAIATISLMAAAVSTVNAVNYARTALPCLSQYASRRFQVDYGRPRHDKL